MVLLPSCAPLNVPLVIHSASAVVTVECAPAQGFPGSVSYGLPEAGVQRAAFEQPSHSIWCVAQSSCTRTLLDMDAGSAR